MSDYFIGEIKIFPYHYAPRGWAYCNGQLLSISEHTTLFAIIGTTYGGNGRTTFALPNLKGRTPIEQGRGPGLTNQRLGAVGGNATVQLGEAHLPKHTHDLNPVGGKDEATIPASNNTLGSNMTGVAKVYNQGANVDGKPMANDSVAMAGNSSAINNRQPYLAVPYCICLDGIFPARS